MLKMNGLYLNHLPPSKYTTTLRNALWLMGMTADTDAEIEKMLPQVFDNFPIFSEDHRKELQMKIVKHFYFQEIGFETWGMFHFRFNQKLQEIMPYYNERYKSETFEYDPMNPTNYNTTHDENTDSTQNTTGNSTSKTDNDTDGTRNVTTDETGHSETENTENSTQQSTGDNYFWETPQTEITDESYATTKNRDSKNSTTNSTDHGTTDTTGKTTTQETNHSENDVSSTQDTTSDYTGNTKNKFTTNIKGNEGIPGQDLIQKYRDVIVNIDMEIIYELKSCFMGVF